MKRKTASQRATEFANKAVIKKQVGDIVVTPGQHYKIECFFSRYLDTYTGEVADSVYSTVYKLLVYRPEMVDLFQVFQKLKQLRTGSIEHFLELYGKSEGTIRYQSRNKLISKSTKLEDSEKVNAFLNKKCVSSILKKKNLSTEQLLELEKLLLSRDYTDFNDNEAIIIDLVLNFEKGFVDRYDVIKNTKYTDIEYYKARYSENFVEMYSKNKNKKSSAAKNNFSNCKEYWQARGYSDTAAESNAHNVQKNRAARARVALKDRISPRTIEFWLERGYNTIEAKDAVRQIQARDLEFYISKYGEEIGHYNYESAIQSRLSAWFLKDQASRDKINASKGRTYYQLVNSYGEDAANSIIQKRLVGNPKISKESKIFFQALDNMLPPDLVKMSSTGYKSLERWVRTGTNMYFLDYIIQNCIIEYNGSYWHGDPRLFEEADWHSGKKAFVKEIWEYDQQRLDNLQQLGYNVLTIWSYDVDHDFNEQLIKCKEFLLEHISHSNQRTI